MSSLLCSVAKERPCLVEGLSNTKVNYDAVKSRAELGSGLHLLPVLCTSAERGQRCQTPIIAPQSEVHLEKT